MNPSVCGLDITSQRNSRQVTISWCLINRDHSWLEKLMFLVVYQDQMAILSIKEMKNQKHYITISNMLYSNDELLKEFEPWIGKKNVKVYIGWNHIIVNERSEYRELNNALVFSE